MLPLFVKVPGDSHFTVECQMSLSAEVLDPKPIEVPEEMLQETLEDKLERFIGAVARERFGVDSEAYETLDEAYDFDDDDDGPLTNYELDAMADEVIQQEKRRPKEKKAKKKAKEVKDNVGKVSKVDKKVEPSEEVVGDVEDGS